jgi:glycosyltransferase involved in cell wall biosynthesis
VVIAARNVAPFIGTALTSVFEQTSPADEVIVVDDGSTDDLASAVEPHLDQITFLRQPPSGEGAARNTAIRAATSEVVVVLDGDDAFHPCRLEAIRWLATARPDLDIIATEVERFGPFAGDGPWPTIREIFASTDQRRAILRRNFLPAPAFRRAVWEAVDGYDEDLTYAPDWELYIRMIVGGARAGLVTDPLYRYRIWHGQLSHDREHAARGRLEILRRTLQHPALKPDDAAIVRVELVNARIELWRERCLLGRHEARADAADLALDRAVRPAVRTKALLSLASPRLARRIMLDRRVRERLRG